MMRLVAVITLLIGGFCSALAAEEPISIYRSIAAPSLLYMATSPSSSSVTFNEPNCNQSFETELKWCRDNAAAQCRGAKVLNVIGIDKQPATCAYEACQATCEDPLVSGNINLRVAALETTIIERLDAMSGRSKPGSTVETLSQELDALQRRVEFIKRQMDAIKQSSSGN